MSQEQDHAQNDSAEVAVEKMLKSKFGPSELIPIKGIQFRVSGISGNMVAFAAVGYTAKEKKRQKG